MKTNFLILFSLAFLLLPLVVSADLGPKPSMEFNLIYETTEPIRLISGQQLQCKNRDCKNAQPLKEISDLQGFWCGQNSCSSSAYVYTPYQKLRIEFSDKIRESNLFRERFLQFCL